MSMKPEFFCCIGAELKDEIAGSLKSSRIFMYRAAESQTIADMLVDGFFNDADDLRVNDLILLYCPEQTRAITYAKVSSVSGGIIKTSSVNVSPEDIPIDTTGYSNISGSNLQQIINSIDAEFSKYLKLDGSTTMTGVLKMRASVSFECAVAPYWHGVGLYKLNDNDSVTLLASMEATEGFEPGTNNTYNIGTTTKKWKNLYLAGKAYMSVINNGFDIAVPVTNSADTLALKSQVDDAANSGEQLYTTGVWFAKMYSASVVPTGAEYDGKNYADFSQVDNDNNPIVVIYEGQSGSWVEIARITPPANHVAYLTITSKIWDIAEQTDQQGGEVLWSYNKKTFTPYPKIVSLLGQANTDLSNLTATGANITNWSSNVSNCITEIPQDINLELSSGTLTLKAGSKCYLKTDTTTPSVNVASDLTTTQSTNGTYFAIYNGSGLTTVLTTAYDYSSLPSTYSLPLAVVTVSGGTITSIDQIFNGFGYIGSAVFALPGVKGLIPNGRNVDGSLNNITFVLENVLVEDLSDFISGLANKALGVCITLTPNPDLRVWLRTYSYNSKTNYYHSSSDNSIINMIEIGTIRATSTSFNTFIPRTVFQAVDYSETGFIAHQAMPSDKYIELTLGASGTTYTAPADGYFVLTKSTNADGQFIQLGSGVWSCPSSFCWSGSQYNACHAFVPVRKGQVITVNYTAGGSGTFRFYYANGAV